MSTPNLRADLTRQGWFGQGRVRLRPPIREHLWAVALLGAFVLVYLWPALIEGRVLSNDSFLYLVAPWKVDAPADLTHYLNTLLSDVAQYHYPWDDYVRHAVRSGTFPSWNPFVLSGTPFYANSQNGLTALFNVPLWLLPLNYALGLVAWAKLWVAAAGAYLLARELRLDFWPGMLAGVCFGLCSFNVLWLEHQTLPASAVWLPWTVLAVERLLRRQRRSDLLWLVVASALAIDGGHPGTEVQVLGAAALYAVLRAGTMANVRPRQRLRGLGMVAGAMVLAAMLMAFVIVPVIMAAPGTVGQASRAGGGFILPKSALRTIFFPEWWGRPSEGNYAGPVNYVERTIYAGAIGLLMASFALTLRSGWRRKLPFLAIGLIGPAVAVDAPLIHWIVVHLPFFSSVQDARMIFWAPFAIAMLAAFGLQALIERSPEAPRRAWMVVGASGAVAVIAVFGLNPSLHEIRTTINHFRTGSNYHDARVLALTAIGWWLIFTLAFAGALLVWNRYRMSARAVAVVLVAVAAVDMYHFAHGFQPMGPLPQAIPRTTPAIAFLQRTAGQSRIVGLSDALPAGALTADANINYDLREATGQDPPQPTLRYFHLWQLANPRQNESFGLTLPQLTPIGLRVMSLLGVRYIVTDPAAPLLSGLPIAYRGSDLIAYRNQGAALPAFVPAVVRPVAGERSELSTISSATFDPRREALIEVGSTGLPGTGMGSASIIREEGSTVRMHASMKRGGLVVLNDAWAKGWSVKIDGRPAQLLRVNDVMRGVNVPAGSHTVVWHYEVPGLRLGAAVSGFTLLVLLAMGVWPMVRLRHRKPAGAPV